MFWDADPTDYRSFRPDLPIEPLSASTVVPILATRSDFTGERTLNVLNASGSFAQSLFFRDSFGAEIGGLSNDLNGRLSEFGRHWMLSDPKPESARRTHESEKSFSSMSEMLAAIGRNRRVISALQLAAALTPRADQRDRQWSWSFNLVVGDSITDRIVYWNSRLLFPPWRDGDQVDLRVPSSCLADSDFVAALHRYIAELPAVSGDNSGGPPAATVRSSTLNSKQLLDLKNRLAGAKGWVHYMIERIHSVDACVPKPDGLSYRFLAGPRGLSTGAWSEERVGAENTIVRSEPPAHLQHCPITLQSVHEGVWAVDLDIERQVDYSPYSNVRDTWRLPRRLRTTRSFVSGYQLDQPHGRILMPRVSRGGFLTLYAAGSGQLPVLAEPTDESAITSALVSGRDWWHFETREEKQPRQLCYEAERSSAGRYFWGVFQLLGGLHSANGFLLHSFWRDQLAKIGATDQRPEQRRMDIQTRLRSRLPVGPFDLAISANLDQLSDIVLQEADAIRMSEKSLSWPQLQREHEKYIEAEWTKSPSGENVDKDEWQGWERDSLRNALQSLCQAGVLNQGLEYGCRRCHHNVWIPIGSLGSMIVCEICGRTEAAPIDRPWQFRLNGFLKEALRRHGIGPLFWALGRVRDHNTRSFWFEGPLNIYRTKADYEARRIYTDVDLTVVTNGKVRMCEVKQSGRQFRKPEALADIFKGLRPDIATVAIMEPVTSGILAKFAKFKAALAGSGIEPELLTFDPERDVEDRAFLGELQSVRIV
jgi:hypothetical protein